MIARERVGQRDYSQFGLMFACTVCRMFLTRQQYDINVYMPLDHWMERKKCINSLGHGNVS